MPDREKVIKGLKCIIDGTVRCESCGYAIDKHGHHSCQQNCASDAIALLKKQEAVVRCEDCKWYQEGIDIDGKPFTRCNGNVRVYGHTKPNWFCADGEGR